MALQSTFGLRTGWAARPWRMAIAAILAGSLLAAAPVSADTVPGEPAPDQMSSAQTAQFVIAGIDQDSEARKHQKLALEPIALHAPSPSRRTRDTGRAHVGGFQPNAHLRVCFPRLSNAPALDTALFVDNYRPFILARGRVLLATTPVNDACMSSGFGPRFNRLHKGMDLSARKRDPIYAAGPGIVREAGWVRGYGKQVVIDHGDGVYTRYAHLHQIETDVKAGASLGFGQKIGSMGNTGNSTGVHLHYEILTGHWGPLKAFGLEAHNPLSFPAYTPSSQDVVLTIDARLSQQVAR
ncbi:MAG: M23 family metallopeptidase [Pseudomonadota bacterium]